MRSTSLAAASCSKACGPWKSSFSSIRGARKAGIQVVEMAAAQRQLIGKDIGQRHDPRGGAVGERRGNGSAAIAAPQQTKAHGGVGLVAERSARLQ